LKNDGDFTGQVTLEAEAVIFYRPDKSQSTGSVAEAASRGGGRDDT
jgi:hypothetical protein